MDSARPNTSFRDKWEYVTLNAVEIGDLVREHDTAKPWRVNGIDNLWAAGTRRICLITTTHQFMSRPDALIQRRPR